MANVYVTRIQTPKYYYLDGLGCIVVKEDGTFGFKDGTHIIEPLDMAIEANPDFYAPRRMEIQEPEMHRLFQAAHNFGFLEYGLDPTHQHEGFMDKNSKTYMDMLENARREFYPLAQQLHEKISSELKI